jgi:hypothetical protein
MDDIDKSIAVAKAVIEKLGGLEYIKGFEMPRAGDPKGPSIWNVYLCVYCHAPVWNSTTVGEEDGWRIASFHYDSAFETCDSCAACTKHMAPAAQEMAWRQAVTTLMLLGKMLLKEEAEDV